MLQIPGEVELCRTRPQGQDQVPADWKGRSLGITDTGSSTDFLTQYLATKNGVDPADTTAAGVGAGATFIAAMKQKAIDCGMTTEPTVSQVARRTAPASSCSTCARRTDRGRRSAAPTRRPRCT